MIVFKHTPDGAFVAGDTERRITTYAYPTSTYALAAESEPDSVAAEMLCLERVARTMGWGDHAAIAAADAGHWKTLADVMPANDTDDGNGFAA